MHHIALKDSHFIKLSKKILLLTCKRDKVNNNSIEYLQTKLVETTVQCMMFDSHILLVTTEDDVKLGGTIFPKQTVQENKI